MPVFSPIFPLLPHPLLPPWVSSVHSEISIWGWFLVVTCAFLASVLINAIANWLPAKLIYDWENEARAILKLTQSPPQATPRLVFSWSFMHPMPPHHQSRRWLPWVCIGLGTSCCWFLGISVQGISATVFCWTLVLLAMIDSETRYLPDILTLPLLWLGLLINLLGIFTSITDALLGAVLGYSALWVVYWGFRLATGQEGMGYGDFKFLAALGAWLGWTMLPTLVFVAAVLGIVWALLGRSLQRWRHTPTSAALLNSSVSPENWAKDAFPFGPALATSGLLHLFLGQILLTVLH